MLAAGRLASQEVTDGTVISVESEQTGWEVHVVTTGGAEQQLRTDQAGTAVVSGPRDDRPDVDDQAENKEFAAVKVDYRLAVEIIAGEIDGGQVNEVSLDRDKGRTTWEADVSNGSEQRTVSLDTDSGAIISNQIDH